MWALDCAKQPLELFEAKYPDEGRPRTCLEFCEAWARGKIKMSAAKRAILDSHAVAKEIDNREYGALSISKNMKQGLCIIGVSIWSLFL